MPVGSKVASDPLSKKSYDFLQCVFFLTVMSNKHNSFDDGCDPGGLWLKGIDILFKSLKFYELASQFCVKIT